VPEAAAQPQAAVLSTKRAGPQPALLSQGTWTAAVVAALVTAAPGSCELGGPAVGAKVPAVLRECNSALK